MSQFGNLLLGAINQGGEQYAQGARLGLAMDEVQRRLAEEQAARVALMGRYDALRPAPSQFIQEQLPPGFVGPPAQVPNPDFASYQLERESIRNAPANVLGNIVDGMDVASRQQRLVDYKAQKEQEEFLRDMRKIEIAQEEGHDESDSPTIAALKHKHGLPLKTMRHLTPEQIAAVQKGDPAGIAGFINSTDRLPPSSMLPKGGVSGLDGATLTKLLGMTFPMGNASILGGVGELMSHGVKMDLPEVSVTGKPKAPGAGSENERVVRTLAESGQWKDLARISSEKELVTGIPTNRAILARQVLAESGMDPEELRLQSALEDATVVARGKKPASREGKALQAAESALATYRAGKSAAPVPAGGAQGDNKPPAGTSSVDPSMSGGSLHWTGPQKPAAFTTEQKRAALQQARQQLSQEGKFPTPEALAERAEKILRGGQ